METYAITKKGQVLIPSPVRHKLGIKEGTRIQIEVDEKTNQITLTPITREHIHRLRGKYKGRGLLKALMTEKKLENGSVLFDNVIPAKAGIQPPGFGLPLSRE